MTIAFVDGFDHYPSDVNAVGIGLYSTWQWVSVAGGGSGFVTGLNGLGKALSLAAASTFGGNRIRRQIPLTTQVSFSFALNITNLNKLYSVRLFEFLDVSANVQCGVYVTIGGLLQVIGENGTVYATSAIPLFQNVVYRITGKFDIAAGSCVIKVSGQTHINLTGADLQDAAATTIGFISFAQDNTGGSSSTNYQSIVIDDMVVLYDEYVDLPELELLYGGPNSDVSVAWSRLSGSTNFDMVDEAITDSDTTYNYSDAVGAKDLFDFPALAKNPESIWGITQVAAAKKEESATRTFKQVLKVDGVEYLGPEHFLSQSYTYHWSHYRAHPGTAAPFVKADYDAAQSGYQLTV